MFYYGLLLDDEIQNQINLGSFGTSKAKFLFFYGFISVVCVLLGKLINLNENIQNMSN